VRLEGSRKFNDLTGNETRIAVEANYFFFHLHNPSGHTKPWSMQIMFLGSRARQVCRADNLAAICEPIV
jgi:hypothetical protein